jgi:tetratricopeptide (TPR) repeat protein
MMRTPILLLALALTCRASDCPTAQTSREQAAAKLQQFAQAAREAFEGGDYARAAESFRQALCLAPDSADIYHGLGLAEAAAGHFDRAGKALAQADRLAPHNFTILLLRAQVETSAGNFELASRLLRDAERLPSASSPEAQRAVAQLHGQLGGALLQKRHLELALAQLLRAARAGLLDPSTLLMLATLENNLGAYSDAIRDATDLDGAPAATVAQRATAAAIAGLAYKNQKKDEEAIRLLKRSIELTPGEPAYLALAEIYEMSEKTAEAVKLLEQGTAALPGSLKIALAFGRTLVDAGDHQRAAAVLSGITQQASADVEAWHWLAQAETSLGNFKKATETLEELARRQPDYPLIDVMIAQSLLKWDPPDYEQALRFLDRAAKTAPTDPDVYYMRGKIYYSLGRYAEAVKPLQRAIELGPTASASYYQLGQTLQKLGREAEAKEQFDKVRYLKGASAAP